MEHWAKKIFRNNYPKNMFKTRLDAFGNDFGRLLNFEKFSKTFLRLDPPWNTGQKKILEKIPPKHVEKTFGQLGNDFGRFLNFENFSKTFRRLDPPLNTGQKKFLEKITPKNVQNTFGHF